jgi:drug/metabolite transporter (DMT)-like permease
LYLVGFAGLFFIIKPSLSLNPYVAMIGLGGAFFTSLAYITVRKLGETDHEFTIILYFTAFASFASLPGLSYRFVMPTSLEWLALAGAGILTQAAQLFMTRGLHREKAAKATNISYINVLFSVIWGILIWGDLPDMLTIIGTLFIAASVFQANRNRNS